MVRIGVLTLTLALAQALALALGLALALALALTVTLTRWRRTTGRSGVQRRQHRRQQMAMVHLPTSPYFSLHPPISPHISPYLPRLLRRAEPPRRTVHPPAPTQRG